MELVVLVDAAKPADIGDVGDDVPHQPFDVRRVVEEGELLVEVILERLRPRRHVLLEVVLLVAFLVDAVAAGPMLLVEVVDPVLVDRFQAVEIFLAVAVAVDDQFLAADRRRRSSLLGKLADASSGAGSSLDDSRSSRTGFSCSSCWMRSWRAMIGSWRISIDWIMRGARIICCFISGRICMPMPMPGPMASLLLAINGRV